MSKARASKPGEDAFGQILWAYYRGKEVFEIWERDDGYISASSSAVKRYFSEYSAVAMAGRLFFSLSGI